MSLHSPRFLDRLAAGFPVSMCQHRANLGAVQKANSKHVIRCHEPHRAGRQVSEEIVDGKGDFIHGTKLVIKSPLYVCGKGNVFVDSQPVASFPDDPGLASSGSGVLHPPPPMGRASTVIALS